MALDVKTALTGKDIPEAITEPQVDSKTKKRPLAVLLPSVRYNSLWAVQKCELAKDMSDTLQEKYDGKTVMNKSDLISNLLHKRYKREENMKYHVAVLDFPFRQLASMTAFNNSTKSAIKILNSKECSLFEPFKTSVDVADEDDHS